MRNRVIILLIFGASVYGMVYVGHHVANRNLREERTESARISPEESEPPPGVAKESDVLRPPPGEPVTEEEKPPRLASDAASGTAEAAPGVASATEATEPEAGPVGKGTAIEGYVFARGERVAGAKVSWRPAPDTAYVPPSWKALPMDREGIQPGSQADLTTDNPLNPEGSNPIRLGGGFRAYDVAIARVFPTVRGIEYEISVDSRFVHASWWHDIYGEGWNLDEQVGEVGIDLTGQETDHDRPSVRYTSVTDGPNNCWRRRRTEFKAEGEKTSVWLHATQLSPAIGCVWFDSLTVRPVAQEETINLLSPATRGDEPGDEYFGFVTTGPQGFYRIEGIGAGEYDLLASAPGKGSAQKERVRLVAGRTAHVDFNLLGGGVIRGKVVENLTAEPIPGAAVTAKLSARIRQNITADGIPPFRATRTGNAGDFYLHGLLPGTAYHVTVEAAGYVAPRMQSVTTDGPEVTLALSPQGGVFGTVVERGTGDRVAEAAVRLLSGRDRVAVAMTDADGRFAVGALKPGTYAIIAEKNGRKSSQLTGEAARVEIGSPVDRVELSLELPSGAHLAGRAVDVETRLPVTGIDLTLTMGQTSQQRYPTDYQDLLSNTSLKDMLGEFSLNGAPEGWDLMVWDPVWATKTAVRNVPEEEFLHPRSIVRTDTEGRFEVDDIGIGFWHIGLRKGDYGFPKGTPTFVVYGRERVNLEVELVSLPYIEGMVVDKDSLAIEGVKVWPKRVRWREKDYVTFYEEIGVGYSDAAGRFRIRGLLPEVEYGLVATAPDGSLGTVDSVKAGDRNVEIVIKPSGSIEGEIRFESGKPLVGAKVTALGGELFGIHWWRDGRTDGEGRFRMKELPRGVYDLDFGTREPELRARYGPVRVDTGEEVTGLEIVIPGHGEISGSVRFSGQNGAPRIVVTAAKIGEEGKPRYPMHWVGIPPNPWEDDREPAMDFDILIYETLTDEAGDYVIPDVQPGVYKVETRFARTAAPQERRGNTEAQTIEVGEERITGVDFVIVDPSAAVAGALGGIDNDGDGMIEK